jgi:hypothetical protein
MSTTVHDGSKGVRTAGLVTLIFGIIFIVAGGITWGAVASNLAAEKITVSDDAQAFGGQLVDTPWEAWFQADIINTHALAATDGKTYAELPQDDPGRQTVMTASFLRASLFTSVVAFGVALLVVGLGVVFIIVGWALRRLGKGVDDEVLATAPAAAAAAPASSRPVAQTPVAPVVASPPPAGTPDPVIATRPGSPQASHVAPGSPPAVPPTA